MMQSGNPYNPNRDIYPGAYVPLLEEPELQDEIKRSFKAQSDLPAVDFTELADCYLIELPLPGLSREDFLVKAAANTLWVWVCHKGCRQQINPVSENHSFAYGLADYPIKLPPDADAAFTSAEYNWGTLRFYIPKINQPVKNLNTRIVVY